MTGIHCSTEMGAADLLDRAAVEMDKRDLIKGRVFSLPAGEARKVVPTDEAMGCCAAGALCIAVGTGIAVMWDGGRGAAPETAPADIAGEAYFEAWDALTREVNRRCGVTAAGWWGAEGSPSGTTVPRPRRRMWWRPFAPLAMRCGLRDNGETGDD